MKPLFFIWTPHNWAAYVAGFPYELPIATRYQSFAKQEYECGLIVTMLNGISHVMIKPITVH